MSESSLYPLLTRLATDLARLQEAFERSEADRRETEAELRAAIAAASAKGFWGRFGDRAVVYLQNALIAAGFALLLSISGFLVVQSTPALVRGVGEVIEKYRAPIVRD